MENYPRSMISLVGYLSKSPRLRAQFPTHCTEYLYHFWDGIRINFTILPSGEIVNFPTGNVLGSSFQFNEDGFTRICGKFTAYFYYTGDKPWKDPNPPWKQSQKDWDIILQTVKDKEEKDVKVESSGNRWWRLYYHAGIDKWVLDPAQTLLGARLADIQAATFEMAVEKAKKLHSKSR